MYSFNRNSNYIVDLGSPAWPMSWTRWPSEVSSDLNHSVILQYIWMHIMALGEYGNSIILFSYLNFLDFSSLLSLLEWLLDESVTHSLFHCPFYLHLSGFCTWSKRAPLVLDVIFLWQNILWTNGFRIIF